LLYCRRLRLLLLRWLLLLLLLLQWLLPLLLLLDSCGVCCGSCWCCRGCCLTTSLCRRLCLLLLLLLLLLLIFFLLFWWLLRLLPESCAPSKMVHGSLNGWQQTMWVPASPDCCFCNHLIHLLICIGC
jgi:hypothetical protein